jgi:hypothetical protein
VKLLLLERDGTLIMIARKAPNKTNKVGRGLSPVVVLALKARRLFECYMPGMFIGLY